MVVETENQLNPLKFWNCSWYICIQKEICIQCPTMPQDYSGQNLKGSSFKGQNLEGANFSGADIRSADFTGANLRRANFSHATAGLQKRWVVMLLSLSAFLAIVSAFAAAFTGIVFVNSLLIRTDKVCLTFLIVLVGLLIFCIICIREDMTKALGVSIIVFAISGFLSVAWVDSGALAGSVVFTLASVGCASITGALLLAIAIFVGERIAFVSIVIAAVFGVLTGSYFVVLCVPQVKSLPFVWLWLAVMAVATYILSAHISWQTIAGNNTYFFINAIAIALVSTGGTSFRNADLTDANFTQVILKNTDFTKANLTRTYWYRAKKLDFANVSKTYLEKLIVRQLVVTGEGIDKNFDSLNLRGVNLFGANLVDVSFIGADLSQANLQNADLSRTKLAQTQLDGTDFKGATLTGAYIQDWGITSDTNFDGVRCEYVYMRLPTKENPDPLRKPDNRQEVFADGEFGDFIKPIFDTLDLYHSQGVDPRAIAISFKELAENHPDAELEIVAMEKRGHNKFLLRAKTASTADKSELSAEYFDTYNQLKGLPEGEIKLLLAEKDNQIRRLENMVMTALERPSFYSNTQVGQVSTMTSNPGGFSVGGSVGGNVNNVQGDGNRAVQGDNNQAVLGDGNQVTQQNQVGADTGESLTKEDVVKLLAQLETLIQGAELPADTKEEVIEDLSAAKKATDKEEPNKQRALERLGTVAETLEKTSKGVEAGQKVWTIAKPIIGKIATWLGVAAGSHLLGL